MLLNLNEELSTAQVVTTTAVSENTIDLGAAGLPVGNAQPNLQIAFRVGLVFAGGTSIALEVITSASAALTSPVVIGSAGTVITANLTANTLVGTIALPNSDDYLRYLGVRYTVVGTMTGGGTIDAFITPNVGQKVTVDNNYVV